MIKIFVRCKKDEIELVVTFIEEDLNKINEWFLKFYPNGALGPGFGANKEYPEV